MNRKSALVLLVLFISSLFTASCAQSGESDRERERVARQMAVSSNSMAESAKSIADSAKSIADSAKASKASANSANAVSNSTNSNANSANSVNANKVSTTVNPIEDRITAQRDTECVRQRTAAGLDTSPCSGWAAER